MAEGPPTVFGAIAFVEGGPLVEGVGRIVFEKGTETLARIFPLEALRRWLDAQKKTNTDQEKSDNKRVITVKIAARIVDALLKGTAGTIAELADEIEGTTVVGNVDLSLAGKIKSLMRKHALQQKNPERSSSKKHRTRKKRG